MRRHVLVGSLLSLLVLSLGCGPKAQVAIYMQPVASEDEYALDEASGTLTVEKEGVQVRVRALDVAELLALAKDDDWNPYVHVSTWGKVTPLFTVFEVQVHNGRESRVNVGPTALLIDANGAQYASLPYDFFKDTYDTQTYERTEVYHSYYGRYGAFPYDYYWRGRAYRPLYYTPYAYYRPYPRSYYVRRTTNEDAPLRRLTARETLFEGAKLFPGAHRSGLLVFERVDEGAQDVRLVLPDVSVYPSRDRSHGRTIEFAFDFRQIVAVNK